MHTHILQLHSYLHSFTRRLQLTVQNNPAQTGHCQQLHSPGPIVILPTWAQCVHIAGLLHSVDNTGAILYMKVERHGRKRMKDRWAWSEREEGGGEACAIALLSMCIDC